MGVGAYVESVGGLPRVFQKFSFNGVGLDFNPTVVAGFHPAFVAYEELADSKVQVRSLTAIVAALSASSTLEAGAYEAAVSRATHNSVRLLRKGEQVRAVVQCSRLFWRGAGAPLAGGAAYARPKELLQCLQKALAIADKCLPPQPRLFVDIFDAYVYYAERRVPSVQPVHLRDLVALTTDQVETMKAGAERDDAAAHLKAIIAHIKRAR